MKKNSCFAGIRVNVCSILFALCIPVIAPILAHAQSGVHTYYVSPSGKDTNPGTANSPFLTIQKAAGLAQAGDTVNIAAGTYKPFTITAKTGTATAPIIFQAAPDAQQPPVIAGAGFTNEYGLLVKDSGYVQIRGLSFTSTQKGIGVYNGDHVTIYGCEIHDIGQEAIAFRNKSAYGIVSSNRIYHTGLQNPQYGEGVYIGSGSYTSHPEYYPDTTHHIVVSRNEIFNDGMQGAEGVNIKGETHHITVERNHIHDLNVVTGGGISIDWLSPSPTDGSYYAPYTNREHVIAKNVIHHIRTWSSYSDGNGVQTRGFGAKVFDNVLYDNQHYGIAINDKDHYGQMTAIYNNTIARNGGSRDGGGIYLINSPPVDIRNNIGTAYPGNLLYNSNLFVDAANNDFHLCGGSAAIDAGVEVGVVDDLDGSGRPNGAGYDIGAFEFAAPSAFGNGSGDNANQLDMPNYFVKQQYLDFLGREPDADGLAYWTSEIAKCGTDRSCINNRRVDVSAAFFIEKEFQQRGSFIYRLYRAGLGRQVSFAEFLQDRSQLSASANIDLGKAGFADSFVARQEFIQKYQSAATPDNFVDQLLLSVQLSSGANLSDRRDVLIGKYQEGNDINQSRSLVLREVVEDIRFKQSVYNPSFVLMQYFGYLHRDPEPGGFDFWLNVLNNKEPGNYRAMVCSFVTSAEYQLRFGSVATHSNKECS